MSFALSEKIIFFFQNSAMFKKQTYKMWLFSIEDRILQLAQKTHASIFWCETFYRFSTASSIRIFLIYLPRQNPERQATPATG